MAQVGLNGSKAPAVVTAGLGPLSVEAGAGALARRGRLLFFSISCKDAPADNTNQIQIQRQTTTGTGTLIAVANIPVIDAGDVPANLGMVVKSNLTVTPTITPNTVLFRRSWNTKYGFDYYPPMGGEIVYPATAASGIVWDTPVITAGTPAVDLFAQVDEK